MQRKRAPLSGDLLRKMALKFWKRLHLYRNQPPSRFSIGPLDSFKRRYKITKHRQHGELGSVKRVEVEEELEVIQVQLLPYNQEDIHNMDETALFWKAAPSITLATEQLPGGKVEKARINANFCCNATGTHKLPIWFIGTAKNPRAFGSQGVHACNLHMVWRSNSRAWMSGDIFREYLRWFNGNVSRKVVLLIDSFSAYQSGWDTIVAEGGLSNVSVIFLPANATSLCQPLDQVIIGAFKAHYRQRWLEYMASEYDADREPYVLMAIR